MLMNTLDYARLPGVNSLFVDYIQNKESALQFYPSRVEFRNVEPAHRAELCATLQRQNSEFGNQRTDQLIQTLSMAGTTCAVTGQQVGILTGPMYTIWKALTAVKTAREIEKQTGKPCVPIFWMASEDHNWHEVMHFGLLKSDYELLNFSLKEHYFLQRQPTGQIPVSHKEVRKILLRALNEISVPQISKFYSTGTLTQAFARTLLWLLKDFSILLLDPSDPSLKKLATPFFKKFFDKSDHVLSLLNRQNERLHSLNYPAQVNMDQDQLPLFVIRDGERIPVKKNSLPPDTAVENLSPAALLRPIFQDYLLPTAAYIGGPAEIAYFAQLHPWYEALDVKQPPVLPRASITLLPQATVRFLQLSNLTPDEIYLPEDTLADVLIQHSGLDRIKTAARTLAATAQERIKEMQTEAEKVDPTLAKAFVTAGSKIQFQTQKMERKALLAVKRKNIELLDRIRKAKNVIFPDEKLQERHLNIFSFREKLPELIHEVHDKMDVKATAHQWIEI
jgi:bacillithiol synthase